MNRALGLAAAFGSVLAGVDGKLLRWSPDDNSRRWTPARETLGVLPLLGQSPRPTEPPRLAQRHLDKRSETGNTCAYLNGDAEYPLYCATTDDCVYNSGNFFIGCCPDTSTKCPIWTTCYDRRDSDKFTTDNGYTLMCDQSSYPSCIRHLYQDKMFSGYTLWGCAATKGTDSVYYTPTDSGAGTSPSTASSGSSGSETTPGPDTSTADSGSSPSSIEIPRPTSTNRNSDDNDDSAVPIGPIVGGVVGGVGALGLVALGAFLIIRAHKKKDKEDAAGASVASGASPPGPPGAGYPNQSLSLAPPSLEPPSLAPPPPHPPLPPPQSQMMQQDYYAPAAAGFPPADASIAKPPFLSPNPSVYDNGVAPPGSPAPTYESVSAPSASYFQPSPTSPAYSAEPLQHHHQSPPHTDYPNPPSPQSFPTDATLGHQQLPISYHYAAADPSFAQPPPHGYGYQDDGEGRPPPS